MDFILRHLGTNMKIIEKDDSFVKKQIDAFNFLTDNGKDGTAVTVFELLLTITQLREKLEKYEIEESKNETL
jgi:hypothetical protein